MVPLNGLDYVFLFIIIINVVLGVIRGGLFESFRLAIWAAAFGAHYFFGHYFTKELSAYFSPSTASTVAAIMLPLAVLVAGFVLSMTVGRIFLTSGLSPIMRSLGCVVGFVKGLIVVMVILMIGNSTDLPSETFWQQSQFQGELSPHVQGIAPEIKKYAK